MIMVRESRSLQSELLTRFAVFRANELCEALYKDSCQHLTAPNESGCLERLELCMTETLESYRFDPRRANTEHFRRLSKWSQRWQDEFSYRICYACIESACQIFFPCGHSLCELCYSDFAGPERAVSSLKAHWGCLTCRQCPFCNRRWTKFAVILPPPTTDCRTLVLDGGGTRGIIALEILCQLQYMTALGLPIRNFFDLIVGTSTGQQASLNSEMDAHSLQAELLPSVLA